MIQIGALFKLLAQPLIAPGRYFARSCSSEQVSLPGAKCNGHHMTIIEIRPFRNGWQVCEAPGVQPVFLNQQQAIDYAQGGAWFCSGDIRIPDSSGNVGSGRSHFSEADRKL